MGYIDTYIAEKADKEKSTKEKSKVEETISTAPGILERVGTDVVRNLRYSAKGILEDIPFARKLLPKKISEMPPPPTTTGRIALGGSRFARDLGLFAATEGATGALSKLPWLQKMAWLQKGGTAARVAKGAAQGAMFGAATAGSEDPKEIAKESAKMAAVFGAIPVAMKAATKSGTALWKVTPDKAKKAIETMGKWVGTKLTQSSAMNMMRARLAGMQKGMFESEKFIRNLKKVTTPEQRKALPFLMEGQMPKGIARNIGREEYYKTLKPITRQISKYLDEGHNFLVENMGKDVGFVENYVPHLWDIPKNKINKVVNWFVTKDPHTKKRLISTIAEGVDKFGLKPKYDDITDMLRVYDQFKFKTVANLRFVKGLTKLKDTEGVSMIQRIDKAPQSWVKVDHPALRRAIGSKTKEGQLIIHKVPVAVHPEIADVVKTALDKPFSGSLAGAVTKINATSKFLNLSLSLFHHTALTEAAIANGTFNPVKIIKAFNKGNYGVWANEPLAKDALANGLSLGSISDVQRNVVEGMLKTISKKKIKGIGVGKLINPVRKAVDVWNKGLWDFYHTTLKLQAYEKLVANSVKKYPGIQASKVKQEVAQFVNDTFGGQVWEALLKTPKWRQAAHWMMLSPDWTLSTIRQAMSPFGVGGVHKITNELRKELGQKFWEKGALVFYGGMNMLNYTMTKSQYGKGRFMWNNPPGHKTHLFMGRDEGQPEQYLRWGKQFRELPEFFIDPVKKFGSKLSPVVRQAMTQLSGYTPTGWKTPIAETQGLANLKARGIEAGKSVLPYSVQNLARQEGFNPLAFAVPISKGMTPYKARELFQKALIAKDHKAVRDIHQHALQNNLNADQLLKNAMSNLKAEKTTDAGKEAEKIYSKTRNMNPEQRAKYRLLLEKQGKWTPKIREKLGELLKKKAKIKSIKQREGVN